MAIDYLAGAKEFGGTAAPVAQPKVNFADLEKQYSLPSGILDATYTVESNRGKSVDSSAGAQGPFQLMPDTAKQYGVKNSYDLNESATAAAKIYRDLSKTFGGDTQKMIAAYNWGQGNVQRQGFEKAPAETRSHLQKMNAAMGSQESPSSGPWDNYAQTTSPAIAPASKPVKPTETGWGDVGTGFVQNIIPSTGKLAGQAVQGLAAISIPVAKGFVKTATNPVGAATDVYNFVTSPEGQQQLIGLAKSVGGDYAKRFGSVEAIKQGLATDPAPYLADLSLALGGLGLGVKTVGTAGRIPTLVKIGTATGELGAAADPFALIGSTVGGAGKFAAKILPESVTTTLGKIGELPGRMASATREYAGNVFDPVTNWLKKTGDQYLPELQQAATQAPKESLPGVTSTFGERVAQAQVPAVKPVAGEASILKKGASAEVNARELARKEVMAEHVGSIGGGEKTLDAMEKVKEKSRAVDYAKVDEKIVKADPELLSILERADKAFKKAEEIAKIDGRDFVPPLDIRSVVEKAYSAGGPLSTEPITTPSRTVAGGKRVDIAGRPIYGPDIPGKQIVVPESTVHVGGGERTNFMTGESIPQTRDVRITDPKTGKVTIKKQIIPGTVTEQPVVALTMGGPRIDPVTGMPILTPATRGEQLTSKGGVIKGGTRPATAVPQFSGETLATIDKVLGDAQKGFLSESRVGPAEATAYKNLQEEYRAWLNKKENLPELKIAQENFSRNSQRIQKTQIAEYLKKKVGDIHNPAGEKEYLALLNDEPKLIKEATGDDTFSKLSDVGFNEFDIKKLNDVKLKAEQRRETQRYAKLGKGENVSVGEPWKHISVLNITGTLANMGMAMRGQQLSRRAAEALKGMLLNPENGKLAQAYAKAIELGDKRAAQDAMLKLLPKIGAKIITNPAAVSAGRINALAPQTEQQNNLTP